MCVFSRIGHKPIGADLCAIFHHIWKADLANSITTDLADLAALLQLMWQADLANSITTDLADLVKFYYYRSGWFYYNECAG